MLWFTIFFLVILKIPIVYLAYVIWWAVKDPPQPSAGPEAERMDGSDRGTRLESPAEARRTWAPGWPARVASPTAARPGHCAGTR